jgi:hypothetical protein
VPSAFEADVGVGPQGPHDLDLLFRAAAAVVKILVEPDKLDFVPPDPDAEPEPSARQNVETGSLFGDEHGLTLCQDQHLGREIADIGAAGEKPEQHERVVIEIGRAGSRLRPAGAAGDIGAQHMVGCRDPVIADLLRRLGKFPQGRRLAADIDNRKGYAQSHLHLRSVAFCARREDTMRAKPR